MDGSKAEGASADVPNKSEDTLKHVSYFQLFRFANGWDYFLLSIALAMTVLKSLVFPVAIIVFSELMAMFVDRNLGHGTSTTTYILPLFGGGKVL